ncbi:MAG: rhomboid family intramembrane serine protease, partial [Acidobacteriota bacterium]|nr:rhomboid family intramembrane serine protease [Acidobacteriota bacterium]
MSENRISDAARAGRLSVCRNCGALVGAGEANCGVCGAPVLGGQVTNDPAEPPVHDVRAMRFMRAVLSRPATFTFVFLSANIFIFLLTTMAGALQDTGVLVAYGAKVNRLINDGQVWRFVTPMFLHGGALHLLMNMYGLFILGPYVEKIYGSARFVVFWVLTGIAGVVASYLSVQPDMHISGALGRFLFKAQDGVSVGASGALFGLIGVLFVFGIKFRHELPEGFKRAFGTGMLPTILINIFIGFAVPIIDNSAHLGGLVAGAVLALFVGYKRPNQQPRVAVAWHALQIAALALVVISFAMTALHFNAARPALDDATGQLMVPADVAPVVRYIEALNVAQYALADALNGNTERVEGALEQLEQAPRLDDNGDRLREDLRALVVRARDSAGMTPPTKDAARRQQTVAAIIKDFH